MPALVASTRCLPNMSASRPATGIVTAAQSSVTVTTQDALAGEVPSSCGSSLWIGMTRVWVRAAVRPPKQSTTTARVGWSRRNRGADGKSDRRFQQGDGDLCMLHISSVQRCDARLAPQRTRKEVLPALTYWSVSR